MTGAKSPPRSGALLAGNRNTRWKRHPQDFYVEPTWCDDRLFQVEAFEGLIWDPACGMGRVVMAAQRAGHATLATDIRHRGGFPGVSLSNFLKIDEDATEPNIVCNPPFGLAREFVTQALKLAERKVAMLLPATWVQGNERSRWLQTTPLRRIWFLAPRPPMPPGPVVIAGKQPLGGGLTDFCWMVWAHNYDGHPELRWLRRDDGITSTHMGPEEKQRHKIKRNGKLKDAKGLPLFKNDVTRDGAKETA